MMVIANELVCHDRFNAVAAEIQAVWARAKQGDPQILPVIGPTRVGKTKLLERVIQGHVQPSPSQRHEIISVVSPKHLTGRALPDACLTSIGLSAVLFKNEVAATDAFVKAVKKHRTQLIIFDETQHMLERGSSTTVRAAADFLKMLFDQTQTSLLLVGLPALTGLFQANEQLADRARRPVQYFPYTWDGTDYKSFRSALAAALQFLAERGWETFDLKDADFARRMYVASAGRYGLINKLFMEVQCSGSNRALYDDFAQAYERVVIGRWVAFNPFDVSQTIQTEHMALAYTQVMKEAGVKV
jgi:hypothetical protein